MEKIINGIKLDNILGKIDAINYKKVHQYLLIGLVILIWTFSISVFFIKTEIEKMTAKPINNYHLSAMELKIRKMVAGHPISKMSRYIAMQDEQTAAFMVAIAKKESNWGKRVPVLNGKDCFNYWGYRQKRERMGSGGHTCFDNPRDAVFTVARRIDELVVEQNLDTPSKMVVWKCGYGCQGHNKQDVKKWITDVDMYYKELLN